MKIIVLFLSLFFSNQSYAGDSCVEWFKESKIPLGRDCLLKCASISTDMGTFDCPNICDQLCKSNIKDTVLFQLSDLYPGLTAEERALSTKYPSKMLSAYKLTWKAEKMCLNLYRSTQTNDESDACRHFVWASLMMKDLGIEFSTAVLNAHEQDPKQPEKEKAMDLANNRQGQIVAQDLIKKNLFNEENVLNAFKEDLKQGRLIVLRKVKGGLP